MIIIKNGGKVMENFNFTNRTKIIFGKGEENNIGKHLQGNVKKVLIHYGGGYLEESRILNRITKSLMDYQIDYVTLDGVVPNPRLSLVNKGRKICRDENVDFILAVGGGSAIDSSKAIAMAAEYDGDVWDFYVGKEEPKKALRVGVVLTIPGAGSEMSESSIITNEANNLKYGVDSPVIVPEISVLNPELCMTLPSHLVASGIADILAHLFERYFTTTETSIANDYLLEGAMRAVIDIGIKIMTEPTNYDYYAELMWLATMAHNGSLDRGRTSDWGSHRIEHEISALYDIIHGKGMAIVFPAWMEYVKKENLDRFSRLAIEVFRVDNKNFSKLELANMAIEETKLFFEKLGLNLSLTAAKIPTDKFEDMADKALGKSKFIGRFKKLNKEDIINILQLAK